MQPILARHGIKLDLDVLQDHGRRLVRRAAPPVRKSTLLPIPLPARRPLGVVLVRLSDSLAALEGIVRVAQARRAQKTVRTVI